MNKPLEAPRVSTPTQSFYKLISFAQMLSSTDLFLLNQEHQKHLEESTGKKSTPVVEDQAPTSHLEESADEPALLQNPDPIDETLLLPYFPNTKPILFPTALYPAPSADYNIFTDTRYAQSLYHLNFAPPHHLDYNPSQYTNTYPPQNAPSNNAIHPSLAHLFRHDPYGRPAPFPHRAEAAPAPQKGKARTMTTYFNSEGVVSAVYAQVGVYELTVNNVQGMAYRLMV